MEIEMLSFNNNPQEYAMLQGWSQKIESWTQTQKQKYLDWSTSRQVDTSSYYTDNTLISTYTDNTYAPMQSPFANETGVELMPMQPSNQSVTTVTTGTDPPWATTFDYDVSSLPDIPSSRSSYGIEMQQNPYSMSIPETRPSEVAPSVIKFDEQKEFAMGEFLQPTDALESVAPSIPDMNNNSLAENWSIAEKPTATIVNDLQIEKRPGFDVDLLRQGGLSDEQISTVLENSLTGVDGFGEQIFDVNTIVGELSNFAFNALVLGPIFQQLERSGPVGEYFVKGMSIYGAAQMLLDNNFIGMGIQASIALVNSYMTQLQRIHDNDYSGDTSDSRLMMVRDGDKWYPAVLKQRMKGEGLIDDSNTINVAYGRPEDLRFVYENGKYRAHFANQKNKTFRMPDDVWDGDKSGEDYLQKRDFMRPYYFLSNDEAQNVMKGYGTKDFAWKIKDVDESEYTPFMKKFSDLQNSMDYMQSREMKTEDPTSFLQPATRGVRHYMNRQFLAGERAFETDDYQHSRVLPKAGENFGMNSNYDSYTDFTHPGLGAMVELNRSVMPRQVETLRTTRKLAATEQGVDWRVYADFDKDLPAATSYDQLKQQYTAIDAYTDRSEYQKQYLQQKAGVRYLMNFVGDMGYGADLFDKMHEEVSDYATIQKMQATADLESADQYYTKQNYLPTRYTGANGTNLNSIPAWQNSGETPSDLFKDNLAGWQNSLEESYQDNYNLMYNTLIDELGYDPTRKIRENGVQTRTINIADQIKKSKQFYDPGPVPSNRDGTPVVQPTRSKKQEKHDIDFAWFVDNLDEQNKKLPKEQVKHVYDRIKYPDKFLDSGEMITYNRLIDRMNLPDFEWSAVGEKSHVHFIEAVLKNQIPWVPKDSMLDGFLAPEKFIKGHEELYKPLLEDLDNQSGGVKQRAAYLHTVVNQPQTDKYLQRFHPGDSTKISELSDDWSTPFKYKQNSVEFNHHITSQMDFDYTETFV